MKWVCAAASLAMMLGCGSASPHSTATGASIPIDPAPPPTSAEPPAVPPPGVPCDGRIAVRLLGVDGSPNQVTQIGIDGVEVSRRGEPVPTDFTASGGANFPVAGAYRMAVLPGPPGDGLIDVRFNVRSATTCFGSSCSPLMMCGSIDFQFDPAKVRSDSCHVVVHLDLQASVPPVGIYRQFVPRYTVGY